jgi:hypothetical protein
MPRLPAPLDLREVFIGSTVRDLGEYRVSVQDVLRRMAELEARLSEDWTGGFDDTIQKCRDRLDACDAYFGIFAYWYGSIPPDCCESITHLEFRWALERWGNVPTPPIAVFMPEGEAEKALRQKANELFQEVHGRLPDAEREQKRLDLAAQLGRFHHEVGHPGGRWRTTYWFHNLEDLKGHVMATCYSWLKKRFETPGGPEPTAEQLGRLGRGEHAAALRKVLDVAKAAGVPAVALLVTGHERAGQKELCHWLLQHPRLKPGRRESGRPSADGYGLPTFVAWCVRTLGLAAPADPAVETVDELAARIHKALGAQHLTLVVEQMERFPGRVVGFHQDFWTPLFTALRGRGPTAHRLVLIAADRTGRPEAWAGRSCPCGGAPDWGLLVELPPLRDVDEDDLRDWLDEVEVLDSPPGRHDRLVERVLRNPAGDEDGTPQSVFDRLKDETLWPDETP